MPDRADVVVIGGGIIGCTIAWRVAQRGADVVVVERGTPGAEATSAAGGMLAPLAEAEGPGPFLDLSLASFERFAGFVAELEAVSGVDVGYRTAGKLLVALDDEDAKKLEREHAWQRDAGYGIATLDAAALRKVEPAVSGAARAGLCIDADHSVHNGRLGRAAWIAAAAADARFVLGASVERIRAGTGDDAGKGRIAGVRLGGGAQIDADAVVLAAGCWSGQIGGLPAPLPVEPVRGQMAAVRAVPAPIERTVSGRGCYIVPRTTGQLVIGATTERVGFRAHTTPAGIRWLLDSAIALVPDLAEAPLERMWAGLRPGTPDDWPILGSDPDVDGLFYATGHYRNGILLAPVTAEIVAALVAGDPAPVPIDAFGPRRFGPPDSARSP